MDSKILTYSRDNFLNLLMSGKRAECSRIAHEALNSGMSIQDLYEDIFKKALYDVGELWETNKISVATEHLSSAIIEAILNELYSEIVAESNMDKSVIVACVEDEYHQIGVKMISDVFEINGWNSHFLGSNTPVKDLISFAKIIQPSVFALSLSIYFNLPILESMIIKIREDFPNLPILVGGQAFLHGGKEVLKQFEYVSYQPDLTATELYIKNFDQHG